ncbi:hypothetical protein [Kordia sp.]|uniref:hypothetical protein n=1 Tax=Kordia sp. TaxID=1965332 RepID=UPI003B5A854C
MKKRELKSALGLNKSVVSKFHTNNVKGGLPTLGPESEDRLHCESENCTHNCITLAYTNCNQCPSC